MNRMLTCREVEEFLLAYLDGELPLAKRLAFQMHIAFCSECKAYLRKYKTAVALGKTVFVEGARDANEEIPEDLVKAIAAARRSSKP
jgi:anti-sigma factor RsiW